MYKQVNRYLHFQTSFPLDGVQLQALHFQGGSNFRISSHFCSQNYCAHVSLEQGMRRNKLDRVARYSKV